MKKTFTDDMILRLNRYCMDCCRKGLCRMECDVGGAKLGYCGRVWKMEKERARIK